MTEDEAKAKWCPFARAIVVSRDADTKAINDGSIAVSGNRVAGTLLDFNSMPVFCIASVCMAWRTRHQWLDNAQAEPDWVSYAPYAFGPGQGQERDDGYCGLAGEPR